MRYTQSAEPLAIGRTSIAVDTGFGDNKKTHFFNISVFGKTAEMMERYVKKGTKIAVECEAKQDEYKDRNGNDVKTVSFIVRNFEFMERRNASQTAENDSVAEHSSHAAEGFYPTTDGDDDDLPF